MPNTDFIDGYIDLKTTFVRIKEIYKPSKIEVFKSVLPDWCNDYLLENESIERNKLIELKLKLDSITELIAKQNEVIEKQDDLKRILISSGHELELYITNLFIELGYEIIDVELNRDDIIIKKNESVAVIEIKGVKGSSAEKHAAQLMKWVSTYHSENGIQPKGILIVNGFKDIPIYERKEKVFPQQMIPYSTRMELCLLTTHQLLEIINSSC